MSSANALLAETFLGMLLEGRIEHALYRLKIVIFGTAWPALPRFLFRVERCASIVHAILVVFLGFAVMVSGVHGVCLILLVLLVSNMIVGKPYK
jgi:hypothetical protein